MRFVFGWNALESLMLSQRKHFSFPITMLLRNGFIRNLESNAVQINQRIFFFLSQCLHVIHILYLYVFSISPCRLLDNFCVLKLRSAYAKDLRVSLSNSLVAHFEACRKYHKQQYFWSNISTVFNLQFISK